MRIILLVSLLLAISNAATSASLCAIKEGPAYQTWPVAEQKLPLPTSRLVSGLLYKVSQEKSDWVQVRISNLPVWAERQLFAPRSHCNIITQPSARKVASAKRGAMHTRPPASKSQSTVPITRSTSGCSCGSGHVCIGPRGGRYCITSGGNKRYGI